MFRRKDKSDGKGNVQDALRPCSEALHAMEESVAGLEDTLENLEARIAANKLALRQLEADMERQQTARQEGEEARKDLPKPDMRAPARLNNRPTIRRR